jgi:hypothetical protein
LLNEGAVKGTDTTPDDPPEAVPIVGVSEGPFVLDELDPIIGIALFYLT